MGASTVPDATSPTTKRAVLLVDLVLLERAPQRDVRGPRLRDGHGSSDARVETVPGQGAPGARRRPATVPRQAARRRRGRAAAASAYSASSSRGHPPALERRPSRRPRRAPATVARAALRRGARRGAVLASRSRRRVSRRRRGHGCSSLRRPSERQNVSRAILTIRAPDDFSPLHSSRPARQARLAAFVVTNSSANAVVVAYRRSRASLSAGAHATVCTASVRGRAHALNLASAALLRAAPMRSCTARNA